MNVGELIILVWYILKSFLMGKVLLLSEVLDKVFFFGVMGKGIVIDLEVGEFVVLVDGEIMIIFLIGYVVGIIMIDGVEILIYIGMDMVELNGNGYEILVK